MRIHPAPLVDNVKEMQRQLDNAAHYIDKVDIDIVDWSRHSMKTITAAEALACDTHGLGLYFDLMLDHPSEVIDMITQDKRVHMVIINLASRDDIYELIRMIEERNIFTGISVDPEHKLKDFEDLLNFVDHVQIMTVEPGAQGNPFLPARLELVNEIKQADFNGTIGVDGGVNAETLAKILEYPVDIASVGSALSKAPDPAVVYKQLVRQIEDYESEHNNGEISKQDLTE